MNNNKHQSILWHDYETWGVNPQKDFPCQFAGIRTDLDLNIIEKPVKWYSQIPNDYLPNPYAALVTGITPQLTLRDGLVEAEFIKKILEQMAKPGTCSAGYNSIRFDDEVTRNTLYRNLHDPYAREWQNGNSRWDIIDLVRACYALRPEGINWVYKDDGTPSFKLEDLTQANQISHADAHDALSDVYATIAIAKLVKQTQPKLYDYIFNLRTKRNVAEQINLESQIPLVHISSKLPAINGCCTWILPIAYHPINKNAVICLNLALDPQPLFDLDIEQIKTRLYQPNSELEEGQQRLPIKLLHLNKCPIVAPAKTLTEENAQRLGIDRNQCLQNLALLKSQVSLADKLISLYSQERKSEDSIDPDYALYSGGFLSDSDRSKLTQIHQMDPTNLGSKDWGFSDPRLNTLLFRYRARNYPLSLSEEEVIKWQRHRQYRLTDPDSPASIRLPEYLGLLEELTFEYQNNPDKRAIIRALHQYAESL
ncbi:exodeoxyribonuclease I [Aliiglaciecola lipolytica]|uniref:Exodeoxyribonuclease I n=1 Tax=Aliiglaciecola lipolytica E3 TaxID=1127673 RepID=K6YCI3_9ALTE|nr:exodeoxyribonuclease I [Aliiglaciecola lipolytica]GAC14323.1 exodeoxyribonuclease I [Aliiglaciecola lipolytica E3]